MKTEFRFDKDGLHVQIAGGMAEPNSPIWIVESDIPYEELPIEFRRAVPQSDQKGYEALKMAVSSWAERNGYKQTPQP